MICSRLASSACWSVSSELAPSAGAAAHALRCSLTCSTSPPEARQHKSEIAPLRGTRAWEIGISACQFSPGRLASLRSLPCASLPCDRRWIMSRRRTAPAPRTPSRCRHALVRPLRGAHCGAHQLMVCKRVSLGAPAILTPLRRHATASRAFLSRSFINLSLSLSPPAPAPAPAAPPLPPLPPPHPSDPIPIPPLIIRSPPHDL